MVDISHEDFNMFSVVDDDLLHFLRIFKEEGHTKDTLLILMSDHGSRYKPFYIIEQSMLYQVLELILEII